MKFSHFLFFIVSLFSVPLPHLGAQESGAEQKFLQSIQNKTPKTVIAVFDISNSMAHRFPGKSAPVLDLARPFAQSLTNQALRKGDRFVLYSFDKAPTKIFDKKIDGNLLEILDKIPKRATLSKVQGTNIRWAHYEGLKIMESEAKAGRPAYLIVLSDGYHDSPDASDPHYTDFYIPLRLDKMPDTPTAHDYTRLANRFKGQNFGVGVQISDNGLVEETKPATGETPIPVPSVTEEIPEQLSFWEQNKTAIIAGLGLLLAGLFGFASWNLFFKPIRVGLGQINDAKKNKIFSMKHGSRITLGGVGANTIPTAFDVTGTKAAIGHLVRSGQSFWLQPVLNQPDGAQLIVNGQPVNARTQLSFGDQIRVKFEGSDRDQLFTFNQASAFRTLLNR